jgi:hypothetical protein
MNSGVYSIAHKHGDPKLAQWVEDGLTFDALETAVKAARNARQRDVPPPLNTGYIAYIPVSTKRLAHHLERHCRQRQGARHRVTGRGTLPELQSPCVASRWRSDDGMNAIAALRVPF